MATSLNPNWSSILTSGAAWKSDIEKKIEFADAYILFENYVNPFCRDIMPRATRSHGHIMQGKFNSEYESLSRKMFMKQLTAILEHSDSSDGSEFELLLQTA